MARPRKTAKTQRKPRRKGINGTARIEDNLGPPVIENPRRRDVDVVKKRPMSRSEMLNLNETVRKRQSAFPPDQARRNRKRPDLRQIPVEGLIRIADVFTEGEPTYGRDNWKTGGKDYRYDAANHALWHLYQHVIGNRNEDHLAKVGWWVVTEAWHEAHSDVPSESGRP